MLAACSGDDGDEQAAPPKSPTPAKSAPSTQAGDPVADGHAPPTAAEALEFFAGGNGACGAEGGGGDEVTPIAVLYRKTASSTGTDDAAHRYRLGDVLTVCLPSAYDPAQPVRAELRGPARAELTIPPVSEYPSQHEIPTHAIELAFGSADAIGSYRLTLGQGAREDRFEFSLSKADQPIVSAHAGITSGFPIWERVRGEKTRIVGAGLRPRARYELLVYPADADGQAHRPRAAVSVTTDEGGVFDYRVVPKAATEGCFKFIVEEAANPDQIYNKACFGGAAKLGG